MSFHDDSNEMHIDDFDGVQDLRQRDSLRCPKFLIGLRSAYFRGKFNSSMSDSSSDILSVPKIADSRLLKDLLEYIVADQLFLSRHNVIPLCYAADILYLPLLKVGYPLHIFFNNKILLGTMHILCIYQYLAR